MKHTLEEVINKKIKHYKSKDFIPDRSVTISEETCADDYVVDILDNLLREWDQIKNRSDLLKDLKEDKRKINLLEYLRDIHMGTYMGKTIEYFTSEELEDYVTLKEGIEYLEESIKNV